MRTLVQRTVELGTSATAIGRRAVRQAGDRLAREMRRSGQRWEGISYRLARRRPDPDVSDDILADRIRSSIGPLRHRLDIPRIHVMVEDHVAILHGDVGRTLDALAIERAVQHVSGVTAVESYLHVGLTDGDSRPSEGRVISPESEAHRRLVAAAMGAGVPESDAPVVLRAALGCFAERLPDSERRHVLAHLPADVQRLLEAPRRVGSVKAVRTVSELVFRILLTTDSLEATKAHEVTAAVIGELRRLVPEETGDIAAVLPSELKAFWLTAH